MSEINNADIWNSHAVQAARKRQLRLMELSCRTRGDRASYTANNIPCYVEPTKDYDGRDIYPPGYHYHKHLITRKLSEAVSRRDERGNWRTDSEFEQLNAERRRRYCLALDELVTQMEDWWYHRPIKPLVHLPMLDFWRTVGDWLVGGGFKPTPGEWDVWK